MSTRIVNIHFLGTATTSMVDAPQTAAGSALGLGRNRYALAGRPMR